MIDIDIAIADRGMIRHVLNNLRDEDAREMAAAGAHFHLLPDQLMKHNLFIFCAWSFVAGPISIWGAVQKRQGVAAGFAFGTADWGRAVLPMVRQIRGFVLPTLVELGIHRVDATALRRRDDVRRFMSLIGAKAEGVLTGYGIEGEDFVSYRWLADEYVGDRTTQAKTDSAYSAH
jgi:hypothetical protein